MENQEGQASSENADDFGYSAKVMRGQKGTYGWEVKAKLKSQAEVINAVKAMDEQLRQHYGSKTGVESGDGEITK